MRWVGGGEGGATLVGALETEIGVACFPRAGGGAGRRRGAPFGAAFLPEIAELINVDMLPRFRAARHSHSMSPRMLNSGHNTERN